MRFSLVLLLVSCSILLSDCRITPLKPFKLRPFTPRTKNLSEKKVHVVMVDYPSYADRFKATASQSTTRSAYHSHVTSLNRKLLTRLKGSEGVSGTVHDYSELVSGFSAVLTDSEASRLRDFPEVLSVTEDRRLQLFTSRSGVFLGLNDTRKGLWRKVKGTNKIVAIIDTGIWPESPSFSESGFGPVPAKFKGKCEVGDGPFKCNKKVIGARFIGSGYANYYGKTLKALTTACSDYYSPRDANGHGSHTAGIAAGSVSSSTQVLLSGTTTKLLFGPARGTAYSARIAVYKALWCGGYGFSSDFAKAIDLAAADGADVISLSLGSSTSPIFGDVTNDVESYFSLKAVQAGIPVVYAAGNSGFDHFTVTNVAPWVMTVGATTIDRAYPTTLVLGNGKVINGQSIRSLGTPSQNLKKRYPIIDAYSASAGGVSQYSALSCSSPYLDRSLVKGKIVICLTDLAEPQSSQMYIKSLGGIGVIYYEYFDFKETIDPPYSVVLPTISISYASSRTLISYYNSAASPVGYLTPSYGKLGSTAAEAPSVIYFSSNGPNGASYNYIKPDIVAPGVSILSAFTQAKKSYINGPSPWLHLSGTSMACPLVAGVVALLREAHPTFTPSMIYSSIMTTGSLKTNRNNKISWTSTDASPFELGGGSLNPNSAVDPGLVYSASTVAYKQFLCSPESRINSSLSVFPKATYCPKYPSTKTVDMNVPSVSFYQSSVGKKVSTVRALRNVGPAATYVAKVVSPAGSTLTVSPTKITFPLSASRNYTVTLVPKSASSKTIGRIKVDRYRETSPYPIILTQYWTFGSITWSDNLGHSVRINVALNAV